ncbi:MAG: hypothetical protein P4M09_11350 [Devosia sp.]|jgi:hypothetical protein|nr:hypothetical protein [Devosia sp.]
MTSDDWIRSAFWVGACKAGARDRFVSTMNEAIVPALRAMPGVSTARALWPDTFEDGPPAMICQLIVEFRSRDDLDLMLASDERKAMRLIVIELLGLFDGGLSHINYRVV